MPLDREDTLKKAEKLLRQGRLDGAIAEYLRVVEDQPRDWNTANTLGDLYVRAEPGRQGGRAIRPHRGSFLPGRLLSQGGRALQKDSQDRAGRRAVAAAPGRYLGQAGAAGRREVVLDRRSGAPAGAQRHARRQRDRRPAGGARSRRHRGAAGRRTRPRGVRRRSGRRDAVPGSLRRPRSRRGARPRRCRRCGRPCGAIRPTAKAARSWPGPRWRRATSTARAAISIARRPGRIPRC